jgi:hypothetical protein
MNKLQCKMGALPVPPFPTLSLTDRYELNLSGGTGAPHLYIVAAHCVARRFR